MSNVSKKRKFSATTPVNFQGTPVRTFFPNRSSMPPKLSAPQLAQVRRLIKRQKEIKHVYGYQNTTPNNSGTMYQVELPAQGITTQLRIGNEIQDVNLEVRGNVNGANLHQFRMIAFQWLSDNTTAPTAADILSFAVGTSWVVNAPFHEDSENKMKILYDRSFALHGYDQMKLFHFKVKCKPIDFESNASSTLAHNAIYIYTCQDGTVSLNNTYFTTDVSFTDA